MSLFVSNSDIFGIFGSLFYDSWSERMINTSESVDSVLSKDM